MKLTQETIKSLNLIQGYINNIRITGHDENVISLNGSVEYDYTIVCDDDSMTVWWEKNHQNPEMCVDGEIGDFSHPIDAVKAIFNHQLDTLKEVM